MKQPHVPWKIFVFNTGGTLGMTGKPLRPAQSASELMTGLNIVRHINISLKDADIIWDSTNIMHCDRVQMGFVIKSVYDDYDAFVILHGTDSLAETCAFLTMLFRGSLQKPILIIGAQMTKDEPGSEARSQIESALKVAKTFARKGIVGVYNVCVDDVLDGSRVRKRNESDKNAFYTPGRQPVAKAWPHVNITGTVRRYDQVIDVQGLQCFPEFEQHVCTLKVSGDAPPHVLMDLKRAGRLKGIILECMGAGNIPDRVWSAEELKDTESYSWIDAIAEATKAGMHVGIISPFDDGRVILTRYELGQKALEAGALSLESLTPAMGDVKFRMAIAAYPDNPDRIQAFLSANILGELLETQEDDDEDEDG